MAVLLGSEGGSPFPTMFFQQSITWACPVVMDVLVYVIGGGGGGAADTVNPGSANGGGAGGCAVSRLTLAVQNYTLTIGAGGAGKNNSVGGNGTAGGNTSMSGTGMTTMTGNGGGAGTNASNAAIAGGTASGGTLQNNTGGGSPAQSDVAYGCSGGGGVGLYGPGQASTFNTANQGIAAGGSPIGITPQQVNTALNWNTHNSNMAATTAGTFKPNGPIGVDVFPGLSRPSTMPMSDLRQQGPVSFKTTGAGLQTIWTGSIYVTSPAGPFSGGSGLGAGLSSTMYSGAGTAGGGGGGVTNAAGGGQVYAGGGGGGLIIMIPLSMGA